MSDDRMKELQDWSFTNFRKVPADKRREMYSLLADNVDQELFDLMLENHLEDRYVLHGIEMAHFGAGMAIRNLLREVLPDDQLPPVVYEGGQEYRNWDDHYLGAIVDWLEFYLDEEISDDYELSYVIARPLDTSKSIHEPGNMRIFTYGNEIQWGTLGGARTLLAYVKKMSELFEAEQYKIYEVSFMEIS